MEVLSGALRGSLERLLGSLGGSWGALGGSHGVSKGFLGRPRMLFGVLRCFSEGLLGAQFRALRGSQGALGVGGHIDPYRPNIMPRALQTC